MPAVKNINDVQQLACELAGQQLRIPNLRPWFVDWPTAINPNLEKLRPVVDRIIEESIVDVKTQVGAKECDFGLLTARIYPKADWRELQIAAAYMVWVFIWDDEIDLAISDIATNKDRTRQYCERSLAYVYRLLDLETSNQTKHDISDLPYPCMAAFREVGCGLAELGDLVQRERTYRELERYITHLVVEQGRQHDKKMPTTTEYIEMRMSTAGVTPLAAKFHRSVMNRIRIPAWVMDSEEMRTIWEETTVLCMIVNDLYSFPKEMASSALQNLVSVIFNETKDMEHVVNGIMAMLAKSKENFEGAFKVLDSRTKTDSEVNHSVKVYVDNCRTYVTGLLEWTVVSNRYKMSQYMQQDGSSIVSL
ncbi:hypothetical protein HIM_11458 [Hirsutella minnesotensis 3608]|uniref:Terpene synthase n=1 Tax=Hirsutella minnesotensis 3608 TaxID=1043627 RepID=A0A0F7ZWL0_9HYPO|nr:hypothetical protein HIM_11458 [Hirsutella minnesotensis 3608]